MSPHTPAEEISFFRDKPLQFEPGAEFDYSSSNYEILGVVIEKVSGEKYGDLLRRRIFQPLGMKDTSLDTDELIAPKRARGYRSSQGGLVNARSESMSVPWAAGSIYSTTGDLLRWELGLFGGKILNDASLRKMTTAGKGNYGLGVDAYRQSGVELVHHGGNIKGFDTQLSFIPERKIAIVVLGNVNGYAPGSISRQSLDVVMGKPVILASERQAVPIEKKELEKFTGVYDLGADSALTIAVHGDTLTAQMANQVPLSIMYQGVTEGHPRFYVPEKLAEIEFVPDATGAVTSLVLHGSGDYPAKRRPDAK
jgi:CubicO group peptidase (beta-lactamase class C family)